MTRLAGSAGLKTPPSLLAPERAVGLGLRLEVAELEVGLERRGDLQGAPTEHIEPLDLRLDLLLRKPVEAAQPGVGIDAGAVDAVFTVDRRRIAGEDVDASPATRGGRAGHAIGRRGRGRQDSEVGPRSAVGHVAEILAREVGGAEETPIRGPDVLLLARLEADEGVPLVGVEVAEADRAVPADRLAIALSARHPGCRRHDAPL